MTNPAARYKDAFPYAWPRITKEKCLSAVKLLGLFCTCQAVCEKTNLLDILTPVYGLDALRMLDFSMYSILSHPDTAQSFEAAMSEQLLYASERPDDYDYSDLFEHHMSNEQELQFKKEWAPHCKADGVSGYGSVLTAPMMIAKARALISLRRAMPGQS